MFNVDFRPNDFEVLSQIREDYNNDMISTEALKEGKTYKLTYIVDSGLSPYCRPYMASSLGRSELEDLTILHMTAQVTKITANEIYVFCNNSFELCFHIMNNGKSWRLKS